MVIEQGVHISWHPRLLTVEMVRGQEVLHSLALVLFVVR